MLRYYFTLFLTIVITVLSTIPVPEVPELADVPFFDKWVHFVMYGALTCAMWLDKWLICKRNKEYTYSLSFVLLSFFFPAIWGGLMELAQAYLTTCRSGDWVDFYADTFGALLGVLLSLGIWKIVERTLVRK